MQDEREDEEPKTEKRARDIWWLLMGGRLKEKCEENKREGYDIELEFCFNISILSKG